MPTDVLNIYFININKVTVLDPATGNPLLISFGDLDLTIQSPNTIIQLVYQRGGKPSPGSTIWKMGKCTAPPVPGPNLVPGPASQMTQNLPVSSPVNGVVSGSNVILWEQNKIKREPDPIT